MNGRPPEPSPRRIAAGLPAPLAAYLVIRAVIGSATGAPAVTEAGPAAWLSYLRHMKRRLVAS